MHRRRVLFGATVRFLLTLLSSLYFLTVTTRFRYQLWLRYSSRGLRTANTGQSTLCLIMTMPSTRKTYYWQKVFFPLWCRDRIIKYGSSSLKDWLLPPEMDYLEVMRAGSHSETSRQICILRLRLLIFIIFSVFSCSRNADIDPCSHWCRHIPGGSALPACHHLPACHTGRRCIKMASTVCTAITTTNL